MAYMTRDSGISDSICIWYCKADELYQIDGVWSAVHPNPSLYAFPKEFKQLFPNTRLPRKGSCKYVELRLYIPGESTKND